MIRRTLAAVGLLVIALPAQAHTDGELLEWSEAWQARYDQAVERPLDAITIGLLLNEEADMKQRHPCREILDTPCPTTTTLGSRVSGHSGMGSNVEQWRPLVAAYFPAGEVDRAMCVMAKESGGNPEAANPYSSARGLFQFLSGTWAATPYAGVSVFDPESNIAAAAWLVATDGWHHWSPILRGEC